MHQTVFQSDPATVCKMIQPKSNDKNSCWGWTQSHLSMIFRCCFVLKQSQLIEALEVQAFDPARSRPAIDRAGQTMLEMDHDGSPGLAALASPLGWWLSQEGRGNFAVNHIFQRWHRVLLRFFSGSAGRPRWGHSKACSLLRKWAANTHQNPIIVTGSLLLGCSALVAHSHPQWGRDSGRNAFVAFHTTWGLWETSHLSPWQ